MTTQTQHARLSPSATSRWFNCPGSIQLTEKLQIEDKTSAAAEEGTEAHALLEKWLDGAEPSEEDKQKYEGIEVAVEYVKSIADQYKDGDLKCEIETELYCSLKPLEIEGLDGGTADVVLIVKDAFDFIQHIELIDYKHGQGVYVEEDGNTQMLCYLVGVLMSVQGDVLDSCTLSGTIIQPRHFAGENIRTATYTQAQVIEWRESTLIPNANAVLQPDAPLVPSESACKWCPAKVECPALADLTLRIAQEDFTKADSTLTLETKQKLLEAATVIPGYLRRIEEICFEEMLNGSTAYNKTHKLVWKTQRKSWIDGAEDQLRKWLPKKHVYKDTMRTLGELTAFLKDKFGPKVAKEKIESLRIGSEPELTVAPITDRRKAQQPIADALNDFAVGGKQ